MSQIHAEGRGGILRFDVEMILKNVFFSRAVIRIILSV